MVKKRKNAEWFVGLLSVVILFASVVVLVNLLGGDFSMFSFNLQAASDRPRVKIVGNTVVASNGASLRGESMHVVPGYGIDEIRNDAKWREYRDKYKLNTIWLLVFRNSDTASRNCWS